MISKVKKKSFNLKKNKIAVIGLGYVGLPLAVAFSKMKKVVGFDLDEKRIKELNNGYDCTLEVSNSILKNSKNLIFTNKVNDISDCKIFIVTVPTPIDEYKNPDLVPLKKASKLIGTVLKKNDIVIFESTVYPGVTEDICVPVIEKHSGLKFNKEFFCGFSPERINPGDKLHSIKSIKKITSGSNPKTGIKINNLYKEIVKAGTHLAPSIKVAEAAKVIENTQRDVNIALINEFAIILNKLNIDTNAVLEAAGTKWNFLNFKPGLVGGHCIGVDPYYLAHKAKQIGHYPEMIISGRNINDKMPFYIVEQIIKIMSKKSISIINSNILIMGLTFKENCPDVRNTKVIDLVNGFKKLKSNVDVYDPWADRDVVFKEYGIKLTNKLFKNKYDVIIIAVKHNQFKSMSFKSLIKLCKKKNIIYDLKNVMPKEKRITKL